MAEKRMFTKKITDSDAFIEMSSAAQALYFHLNQGADDDGFNNQVQMAMWKAHASIDDLKVLLTKNYIIRFESGVIVIKHWRMHNTLRKDRYTATNFQEELNQLGVKGNGAYTLGCQVVANGLPQVSIVEDSIDKVSLGERGNVREDSAIYGEFKNVVLAPSDHERLISMFGEKVAGELIDNLSRKLKSKGYKYEDHYATILIWAQKDGVKPESAASSMGSSFDTDEFFKAALARSYKK